MFVAVRVVLIGVTMRVAISVMAVEPLVVHIVISSVLVRSLVRMAVAAPFVAVVV